MTPELQLAPAAGTVNAEVARILSDALHSGRNLNMAMRGYAELICRRGEAVDHHAEWARRIIGELDRLTELYARMSALTPPPAPWRWNSLADLLAVAEVQARRRVSAEQNSARIALADGSRATALRWWGDPLELERALATLLENALEASPHGGIVRVRIGAQTHDRLRLEITDDGAGFSAGHLRRAGQPFVTTKPGRLGLGLFLARSILGRHGLTLAIENRNAGGARVAILRAPGAPALPSEATVPAVDPQGGTP